MKEHNNEVELLGIYGSDETIALSAWTSTSRDLPEEKRNRIGKIVKDLWKNRHKSPYEKGIVHFLVNTDIASHIHLLKHRIASINGESANYKELKEDKYYLPEDLKYIACNTHDGFTWYEILESYSKATNKLYHECLKDCTPILGKKRAREVARFFKMYNSQIQADVLMNMSSFANFLELRQGEKAQKEIKEIAYKIEELVKQTGQFNNAMEAIKERQEAEKLLQDPDFMEYVKAYKESIRNENIR